MYSILIWPVVCILHRVTRSLSHTAGAFCVPRFAGYEKCVPFLLVKKKKKESRLKIGKPNAKVLLRKRNKIKKRKEENKNSRRENSIYRSSAGACFVCAPLHSVCERGGLICVVT